MWRWIAIRAHFYRVPLKDFQKIFKRLKNYDLDQLAVYLSDKLSK